MNDYRHVCFKDLENYIRRDNFFGDLNEWEKDEIRSNLNIPTLDLLEETRGGIVCDEYEKIKEIADAGNLNTSCTYIINDFRTIYESNTGEVWGLDVEPSSLYSIILHPISSTLFSKNVEVMENGVIKNWIVKYDFTLKLIQLSKTKGEILYLKDEHNNSAYYDFKNIKFAVNLSNDDVTGLRNGGICHVYTFSKYNDNRFEDNSNNASNNQFDFDCYNNVFLGRTVNNHFYGGFKGNVFVGNCECNKFEWNTSNNKFEESISHSTGSIKDALVTTNAYDSAVSKLFKMLYNQSESLPVFVVTYLDGETLTNQVIILDKNT